MEKSRFEELLESLNKGEPIVYEPRSRLEEHLVAIINKEGKEGLGEPRSRAEELLQIHAEQCANGGLGGGSVVIEESAATAVPNEGYVENVYFNTSLTSEEVDKIIADANLEMVDDGYFIACSSDGYKLLAILIGNDDEGSYVIMVQDSSKQSDEEGFRYFVYTSNNGWLDKTNGGLPNGVYNFNAVAISDFQGLFPSGNQNEALKMLISSTSFNSGKQPVPNSGYVDTIKFNTNLSQEEIHNIIHNANLNFIDINVGKGPHYLLMGLVPTSSPNDPQTLVTIIKLDVNGTLAYGIMDAISDEPLVFYSPDILKDDIGFSGWNPMLLEYTDQNGIISIPVGPDLTLISNGDGMAIGTQNSALTDLVYIGEDLYRKELTGTYEPVTVEVTENSEIDLTTYMDEQKMPIKVNVNIEETGGDGTAMLVSTAEEMDALLVEENVGKIYKFVGTSDETYTNGQYYIIEEVE